MKKPILLLLGAAGLLLLLSAVVVSQAAALKNPFFGVWYSIDTDGSNQMLTIGGGSGDTYHVRYHDDGATACGLDPVTNDILYAASAMGPLSGSGGTIAGNLSVYCLKAPPSVLGVFPFRYTYDSTTDTLTDLHGVVWHH